MSGRDNRDDVGLSCNLAALDETQRKRRALLAEWLQVSSVDISDVSDGYAFHLDPICLAAQHIDEFVAFERLCCPFLKPNVLPVRGDSGSVVEIGGGEEVKAFVASDQRRETPWRLEMWTKRPLRDWTGPRPLADFATQAIATGNGTVGACDGIRSRGDSESHHRDGPSAESSRRIGCLGTPE